MSREQQVFFLILMLAVLISVVIFNNDAVIASPLYSRFRGPLTALKMTRNISILADVPLLYISRRSRLQTACRNYTSGGHTHNILVYRNMSYGVVPKAGCTFWIRVFRFLHNDTNGRACDSPFKIPRTRVHGGNRTMKIYKLHIGVDRKVVMATTRFMVARNPYTRLFSAYIDKLFLPDYWPSVGRKIVSLRNNASDLSRKCGHDVTFNEFLSYIADVGEVNPVSLNGHWRPIEHTCNPCIFQPDIVATQETFTQDSRYIMKKFGVEHLFQTQNHVEHVLDEMTILTDWNFGRRSAPCLNRKRMALRIWHTFQMNGYLLLGSESVLDNETEVALTARRLKHLVTESFKSSPLSKLDSSKQRKYYQKQAYSEISPSVIDRIVRIYKHDFLYFGYDTSLENLLLN